MRKIAILLVFLFVFIWAVNAAAAESQPQKRLTVDISQMPPCVMKNGEVYSGFDMDIWEEVAKDLSLDFQYQEVPFAQIFEDIKSGRADLAVGGISITEKREEVMDFSYPYFNSGVRILTTGVEQDTMASSVITAVGQLIFSWSFLKIVAALSVFLVFFGLLLRIIELWHAENPTIRPGWAGLSDACWCIWAQMTTMGFGDVVPKRVLGRMLSLPSYITGAIILATIVSAVTAAVTVDALKKEQAVIRTPRDLFGKVVATVADTTSVDFLNFYDAKVLLTKTPDEAIAKFINGEAEAVVYDSPTIMYFVNHYQGEKKIAMVEKVFDEQDYGILLLDGSDLRDKINCSLLKIKENGTYERIYQKWFGKS